ncbi:Conserved_hypothetical protein [Hexamita inflata]|uniref:Uncharacterized protein n=1 Tax=Hexamita inflata TaxID=28002 RepID=A0AA86Q680_9EUKA|nr:Conserved hypothetical protein [Hexamita inflata]
MILYSLKPKLQLISDNMQISQSNLENEQSGLQSYRMKPKQFQKEDINLFDIPAQQVPFRIPGTKIGIITSSILNENQCKNEEDLKDLLVQISLSIDVLKRISKLDCPVQPCKYEALEISEECMILLTHRQQLQVLNDLVSLRKSVNELLMKKDQWVERITEPKQQNSNHESSIGVQKPTQTELTVDLLDSDLDKEAQASLKAQKAFKEFAEEKEKLNTEEVNIMISQLKMQSEEGLQKSIRPPPSEEPPKNVYQRPYSPNIKEKADIRQQQAQIQKQLQKEEQEREEQEELYKQYRQYLNKYRHIEDFKRSYESQYNQMKLRPQQEPRKQRNFIIENIMSQQYYKKGAQIRPVEEDYRFQQDVDQSDDNMSQMMMRICMQQLVFKANNGDLAAYKRLVLLQEKYKRLFEPNSDPLPQQSQQQHEEPSQEQIELEEERKRKIVKQLLEEREREFLTKLELSKNPKVPKKHKIPIPQFTKEFYKQIVNEHKHRIKCDKEAYKQMMKTGIIAVNTRNPDYEKEFGKLCNVILNEIIQEEVQVAVQKVSDAIAKE